jgi:hypothetical protein
MKEKQIRIIVAIIVGLFGLGCIATGFQYNLSHFDVGPEPGASFFTLNRVDIGLWALALVPLILKKYLWLLIQLALTVAFFIWTNIGSS